MADDRTIDNVAEWSALQNERFAAPDFPHVGTGAEERNAFEVASAALSESAVEVSAPDPSASARSSESDGPVPLRWTVAPEETVADVLSPVPHDDRGEESVSAGQGPDEQPPVPTTDDRGTALEVLPHVEVSDATVEGSAPDLFASDASTESHRATLAPVAPEETVADVLSPVPHDDRGEESVSAGQGPDEQPPVPTTDDRGTALEVLPHVEVSDATVEGSAPDLFASDASTESHRATLAPVAPEGTVAAKRARTRVFHDDSAETSASADQAPDEPAELRAASAVLPQGNGSHAAGALSPPDRTLEADRDHWRERAVIWHERAVAAELVVTVLQRHVDDLHANLEDLRLAAQASPALEECRALTPAGLPWRHFVEELRVKYFATSPASVQPGTNGSVAPGVGPDAAPATADRLPPEEHVRS